MQTSFSFKPVAQAERISIPDAELILYHEFLAPLEADHLLKTLLMDTPWRQEELVFGGKKVKVPRLQAWFGDYRSHYRYSGLSLAPLPWTPALMSLKIRMQELAHTQFNAVLLNYYRNGQDSVSWHSDDEALLGSRPVVASISLGSSRRFELKHRYKPAQPKVCCILDHASALVMGAGLQENWQHRIPKQKEVVLPRINLTFRKILKSG